MPESHCRENNEGGNKFQYSRYIELTKMAKIGPNLKKKTVF